jgi:hypothetical protein
MRPAAINCNSKQPVVQKMRSVFEQHLCHMMLHAVPKAACGIPSYHTYPGPDVCAPMCSACRSQI